MRNALLDPSSRPVAPPPADPPEFDAWLRNYLDRLHASVLTEPVPEHLLRVLHGRQG